MQSMKVVMVGDSGTGKSFLLSTFIRKAYPGPYHPDFLVHYSTELQVLDQSVQVNIWITAGSSDYDRLRLLIYPSTDVVILCFSISDPASFENVTKKWIPEVEENCPGAPVLLVGTKKDTREDQERNPSMMSSDQGEALAKQIRAEQYLECASIKLEGLDQIFETAARVFLQKQKRKKPCSIF